MKTLMDKINHFESLSSQTVKDFNEIFTNSPLESLAPDLEVEIGELADSDTTRFLTVGKLTVKHSFQPVREMVEEPVKGMNRGSFGGEHVKQVREKKIQGLWR